jgi:phosphatidylglycerophosphatase A
VAAPVVLEGGAASRLARAIATGFGLGRVPRAPGTAASLAAALAGAFLLAFSPALLAAAAVLALAAGLWALRRLGVRDDPPSVVIDEIAGQWIALLGAVSPGPYSVLAAFLLFRVFDIAKPGPIRAAERLPGAAGVMADDVLAGILAGLLLFTGEVFFPVILRRIFL